ncbi:MAG: DUF4331 domain-containing protein [Pseudonocardia sp.]|nr:DUF4331 domain-containing protein [Pseudonocardia sp.]
MSESPSRRRAATAMVVAGATLTATALALVPGTAGASSHREAPLISTMPLVDNTDVYSFVSPDKPDTVTFVANWFPFSEPDGGPNFYQWQDNAHYDINIDADGDAVAETTYRWDFRTEDLRDDADTFLYNVGPIESLDDPDLLFRQFYTLTKITPKGEEVLIKDAQVAPSNVGPTSIPDYEALREDATYELGKGGQTFTGQTEDPFFLDLRIFDLLYGGDLSEIGKDTLTGYNVNTITLQVPISEVALNGDGEANPVIGVWSDTETRTMDLSPTGGAEPIGDFVQVSRLGNPLVNEVVSDIGLKDPFNASTPADDANNPALVDRVLFPEVPELIEAIYGIPAPEGPRFDLFEIFLTGIATNAPTPDGSPAAIQADLNSQLLNADVVPKEFVPAEMLRLNTAIKEPTGLDGAPLDEASRLGALGGDLQGFPNGRRLADDVVDIELQALAGAFINGVPATPVEALIDGDAVDENDKEFGDTFPYVALPNNTSVNDASNSQTGVVADPDATQGAAGGGFFDALTGLLPGAITGMAGMVLIGAGSLRHLRQR